MNKVSGAIKHIRKNNRFYSGFFGNFRRVAAGSSSVTTLWSSEYFGIKSCVHLNPEADILLC